LDFTPSHSLFTCFSTLHIVGSLLFKLPSINIETGFDIDNDIDFDMNLHIFVNLRMFYAWEIMSVKSIKKLSHFDTF